MFVPIFLATVCLTSSTVLAAYDKPYYEEEDAENLFKDFLKEHQKVYNRREYFERLEIFKKSLQAINKRNAMFPDTVFGVDHFADLKPHELMQYNGLKLPNETVKEMDIAYEDNAPKEYDWRKKDAVTHVKKQGDCGSCYIFAAVGNIEGQYSIKHGQCLALSDKQALDCLDCGACDGGYMEKVMQELAKKQMKLEKESDYIYTPAKNDCEYKKELGVVLVKAGKVYKQMDEEKLKARLLNYGPLSIALNDFDLYGYRKGILKPDKCKGQDTNHAVLLVGYGEENGTMFWTIKNSWGVGWGDKGYVKMLRGSNACGIGSTITESTVE